MFYTQSTSVVGGTDYQGDAVVGGGGGGGETKVDFFLFE